jgi:[Skp1-protein]-hydroxyproline N-acetylglucosaminyltransferase
MKKNTIFVSIASYRDDICNLTLKSLYEMASKPENIYVGICQQNKKEDLDCYNNFDNKNVRMIRIPHYEAKGPTYARYLCSTLWNGEEYYLQIDSHSKFIKDWDVKCIDMIKKLKQNIKKPVLSHYPREIKEYEIYSEQNKHVLPRICKAFFNDRGMISFMSSEIMDTENKFYNTPFVAGGMFFCESYFLNELPYDPNLPYLFTGEEILHSIRFYTHGWDIYTPTENILFHEYTRSDKPKIWTDDPHYSDSDASDKVKYYLKLENDDKLLKEMKINIDKYGIGKIRTLEDYYNFAGINIKDKKVYKNFCRKDNNASKEDISSSNQNPLIEKFDIINKNYIFSLNNSFFIFLFFFIFIILI